MLTPKIAESVSLITAVVDSESVTCQLDEDTENPAIRSKVPGTLPTFEIVELNEMLCPGVTIVVEVGMVMVASYNSPAMTLAVEESE